MRSSLALLVVVLAGCPGTIEEPGIFTGDASCDIVASFYIKNTCLAGCHSADRAEGELDLETPPVRERLLGEAGDQEGCDAYQLVNEDEPEQSLMYLKLGATGSPPCGNKMPLFANEPTQRQLDCMLEWIAGQPLSGGD